MGLSVHPTSSSSLLSHSARRIPAKSPYAVVPMPHSHTSYAAGFPAMPASAYATHHSERDLHASSPMSESALSSSHPFLQEHSPPSSPSHERLLAPAPPQHQPRFSPYALMHGQSTQYAHAASLRRGSETSDVDASEQQQLISASQGDRSEHRSDRSGGGSGALSLADLEAANESEGEGGDRFASSSGASATPIGSPAILHQPHPYASSLPHSSSASSALKLSLDAQSNAAASSRNVLSASASQYHLKNHRAPVDLAGARKKDDSLQQTGHGAQHLQSNLPLHLQQGVLHVNLSRGSMGGMGLGMGGIGVGHSPLDRSFYTRQLQKLKAVSHQVQARVKRAMSVGASSHGGALLLGGSSSGLGNLAATPSAYDRVKHLSVRRWKEISVGAREKLLFFASSLLGSLFFFVLFEAMFRVTAYHLSTITEESLFMFSYVIAYLISILYQHALNRLLIFRAAPYCSSLCHTYAVYSISLAVLTTVGACLIRLLHVNPRLIACITLPASGVLNYYLLRVCIEGSARDLQDSEMTVLAQPNSDTAASSSSSQQPQPLHSKPKRSVSIVEREKTAAGGSNSNSSISSGGGPTAPSAHNSTTFAAASDSNISSGHLSYGGHLGVHALPLTSPLCLSTSPPTPSLAAGAHTPNANATGAGSHAHAILPSGFPSAYAPRRSAVNTAKTNAWQQYANSAWAPASAISGNSGSSSSSSNTFSPNPVVSL